MDPVTIAAISSAVGALGNIFGGNMDAASQQKWYQNALVNLLNSGNAAKQFGQDLMFQGKDELFSRLMPFLDNVGAGSENFRKNYAGLLGDMFNPESQYSAFNFFNQNPADYAQSPERQQAFDFMRQIAGSQQGVGDLANKVFQGGGWTQQGQNIFDSLDQFRQRGGANDSMRNIAQQVIAGGGANPYSNFTVDAGTKAINQGGQTGQSNALMNYGLQGLDTKGMTPWDMMALNAAQQGLATQGFNPNSNMLSSVGQGLLASGGQNANNQFLTGRGRQILNSNPLLGMDEVTNAAADQAGSLFAENSIQNYEQAMKRGGGPAVRSGLQNQAVQENEDEILRAIANSTNQARMGQQGLQLQQFGQGANMMDSGMSDIARMLGVGGSLTGQGEQAALQRMLGLTGLGSDSSNRALNAQQLFSQMLGQSGQLSNQNMATLGGLGMQGLGAANDKLGMGINLFGQTQGNDLQALQQYLGNLSNTNQYALGMGNLSRGGYGDAVNTGNSMFGNSLANDQFGFGRQNAMYNAFGNNMNRGADYLNSQQGNFLQGLNPLSNFMNQGFNMYNQALSGTMGLFGGYKPNESNPYGGALSNVITAGGSILGTPKPQHTFNPNRRIDWLRPQGM